MNQTSDLATGKCLRGNSAISAHLTSNLTTYQFGQNQRWTGNRQSNQAEKITKLQTALKGDK